MNIAVWHNVVTGGGLRALADHLRGLRDHGHTVEVWCVGGRPAGWAPFGPGVRQHVIPLRPVSPPPRGPLAPFLDGRARLDALHAMDEACARCAAEMNAGAFDVAFVNTCSQYGVPFVSRHLRLPTLLYLHEPFRRFYEADPTLPWVGATIEGASAYRRWRTALGDLKNLRVMRAQARLEWRNVHAPDAVLVNSYYSRESVLRAYARDSSVCYLGVDTRRFTSTNEAREPFVIALGAMVPAKSPADVIRTVGRMRGERPPLVWVSDRGGSAFAHEMAQLALAEGVALTLLEGINDAHLVSLLSRATAMLYAPRLEPFGLAPLEANACGTPVVGVAEAGVRETVVDGVNGILVPRDHAAMAAALAGLFSDPGRARTLGEQASRHVRAHWTHEQSIERLDGALHRVAARAASEGVT